MARQTGKPVRNRTPVTDWLQLLIAHLPEFWQGFLITIRITLVGLGMGIVLGIILALARVYGAGGLRSVARGYIELFRGTPLLVQLFIVYYGLPGLGLTLDRTTAAYLTLGLNSAAYQAEYFRGAIQAIGHGQMMAARSIGMTRLKAIVYVILPQALRLVIPSWSNEPVSLMKASAVVFLIGVPDLMTRSKQLITRYYYSPIDVYLIAALFYLVLVLSLTLLLNAFSRRLEIPGMDVEGART